MMKNHLCRLLFVVFFVAASEVCNAQAPYFQVPQGPRTTLRGRIRIWYGPLGGRYYFERWGGGMNAYGAQTLTTLGTVFLNNNVLFPGGVFVPGNNPPAPGEGPAGSEETLLTESGVISDENLQQFQAAWDARQQVLNANRSLLDRMMAQLKEKYPDVQATELPGAAAVPLVPAVDESVLETGDGG